MIASIGASTRVSEHYVQYQVFLYASFTKYDLRLAGPDATHPRTGAGGPAERAGPAGRARRCRRPAGRGWAAEATIEAIAARAGVSKVTDLQVVADTGARWRSTPTSTGTGRPALRGHRGPSSRRPHGRSGSLSTPSGAGPGDIMAELIGRPSPTRRWPRPCGRLARSETQRHESVLAAGGRAGTDPRRHRHADRPGPALRPRLLPAAMQHQPLADDLPRRLVQTVLDGIRTR